MPWILEAGNPGLVVSWAPKRVGLGALAQVVILKPPASLPSTAPNPTLPNALDACRSSCIISLLLAAKDSVWRWWLAASNLS